MNFMFISLSHRAIFFLLYGAQLSDKDDFIAVSNNQACFTTTLVGFKENTKYPVFSFSSLWEYSFISSSLCKTNLPATAIILN